MVRKNKDIIERKIHDCFFLINIKERYLDDRCQLYELNEIGHFIWNKLDSVTDVSAVAHFLLESLEENVEYSIVYQDTEKFTRKLLEEGFLEVHDGRN